MIGVVLEELQRWGALFLVAVAIVTFVAAAFRRTKKDGVQETITNQSRLLALARSEVDLHRERAERLESELGEQRARHTTEIATANAGISRLEGVVAQQGLEMESLRRLILMQDKVPFPFVELVESSASKTVESLLIGLRQIVDDVRKDPV